MKNSARFFGKLLATVIISSSLLLTAAYSQESGATAPKKSAPKKSASAPAATAGAEPFIGKPDKIKWVQFAPSIEYGSVHGNCDKPGAPCVFQLRFAEGGKIPPHWHPVDENVTVISGTFMAGMGDSSDESKMMTLPVGTYVFMPRTMHHFAGTHGGATVQVHGVGPFKINYVNPADDPAKVAKATK
jgi:ChrR-like protein with cupin domain